MDAGAESGDALGAEGELAQLRARNAALEAKQNASFGRKAAHFGRAFGSTLLIVLGVLCLVLSPVTIWGRNLVLDTDRYVQTLEPLASDSGVQQTLVNVVSTQVSTRVNVGDLLQQTSLPPRAIKALEGPIQGAVNSLVTNVTTKFVESKAFHKLWVTLNRVAHTQLVYLLTGERAKDLSITISDSGVMTLNLAPVVDEVKKRLVAAGLTVANKVPAVGATIKIADVKGLKKAQTATRYLDDLANWLPWIGLVLCAGGIAAARHRRRAVIVSALSLGAGMIVIGVGLLIGRNLYLDGVTSANLSRATASSIFDTLVRFLRWGIRLVLLVALLVAFGTWVSGGSKGARSLRRNTVRAPRALGAKLNSGPVGPFVERHATPLRVGIVVLMFMILLLIDAPSIGDVIWLAVIAVLLLLGVELLRSSAGRARTDPALPQPTPL